MYLDLFFLGFGLGGFYPAIKYIVFDWEDFRNRLLCNYERSRHELKMFVNAWVNVSCVMTVVAWAVQGFPWYGR